ncbi:hypothetical protein SVIO_102830 [Streptomyces violaceusniger]|uniref:Uncharacterized protein n=1 Tax=Streptomyces violaceusniger TaxID=68280 RepID=A0A4D4LKA8_STRVO|nr:hypothetical protein SVIO_102830 [Streptomyces violaceusniger]
MIRKHAGRSRASRQGWPPTASAGAFTPDALAVSPRQLEIGGEQVASFAITGFPREVYPDGCNPC